MGALEHQASDAFRLVDRLWAQYFAPPADLSVAEWADGRLLLPKEMSAEPGPFRLERTPYLRKIFEDLADPSIEEIVLMFATQLGKSTAVLALLSYVVDHDPAPVMLVLPTLDVAKKFSKQRIAPLIAANDMLSGKIADARARDSDNTLLVKGFAGGMLVITGANAPSGLASMPAKILLLDEVDDYPEDAGGQGEPTAIATARQDTFTRRKRVKSSSPKRPKGRSMIEAGFEQGTGERYYVACPDCSAMQTLRWPQLKWTGDDAATAAASVAYACESCGVLIPEHAKTAMLAGGEWRAERPDARMRSYHLNSLYSPLGWLSWATLVREWWAAKARTEFGDPAPLRTFINTRLAETWEEQAEKHDAAELEKRAEPFALKVVPEGALLLVAFVDVQDDRFELGVWGFGDQDDMYTVDHLVIPANPGTEEDWLKLDAALQARYRHARGGELGIDAAGIDTGGHYTHDVYRFVRRLPSSRKVAATKGMDKPGMPILGKATTVDVNWRGGVIKHGCKLWGVGVNAAKDALFSRIKVGRVHMSRDLPAEWFRQLAAEHRVEQRTARGVRYVWTKRAGGVRNEALDVAVGALWCAERLGISRWPRKYWDLLRQRVTADLFSASASGTTAPEAAGEAGPSPPASPAPNQPARPAHPVQPATLPRRGGGFVNRWKRG